MHVPEDHLLDVAGLDPGALDRLCDGEPPSSGARNPARPPWNLPMGDSRRADDDDFLHGNRRWRRARAWRPDPRRGWWPSAPGMGCWRVDDPADEIPVRVRRGPGRPDGSVSSADRAEASTAIPLPGRPLEGPLLAPSGGTALRTTCTPKVGAPAEPSRIDSYLAATYVRTSRCALLAFPTVESPPRLPYPCSFSRGFASAGGVPIATGNTCALAKGSAPATDGRRDGVPRPLQGPAAPLHQGTSTGRGP